MRLPGYRMHSSGQARVSLSGGDYLLGAHGSKESKQKYNRLVAEWLASNQSKSSGVPVEELLIVELLAAYTKYAKKYYGDGPESEYHRIKPAVAAMRSLYGTEPAADLRETEDDYAVGCFANGKCVAIGWLMSVVQMRFSHLRAKNW